MDAGHWNVHTAGGRYKPFADLARHDGYRVDSTTGALTSKALATCTIFATANALGVKGLLQFAANRLGLDRRIDLDLGAFSAAETTAVRDWVAAGGSALLIADHAPTGEAMRALAAAFGVGMSNGWAEEPTRHDPDTDNWGFLVFTREAGGLVDHAITNGRGPEERVSHVISFTGQSLTAPPGAVSFLALSAEAREYPYARSHDDEFTSAAGRAQGVALEYGRGRVVVMGEAAMLTSQVARGGGREMRFGLSRAGYENRQLALNILHWLSRLI